MLAHRVVEGADSIEQLRILGGHPFGSAGASHRLGETPLRGQNAGVLQKIPRVQGCAGQGTQNGGGWSRGRHSVSVAVGAQVVQGKSSQAPITAGGSNRSSASMPSQASAPTTEKIAPITNAQLHIPLCER